MLVILSTKNNNGKHGSGIEFNLYNERLESQDYLDLSNGKGEASVSSGGNLVIGTDDAKGDATVVIDGTTTTNYLSVASSNGSSVYVTVDMKGLYNVEKVDVDVYSGRTYKNVVIVTSETLEGFDNPNERYVIYNTDVENKSGMGLDRPIDNPQEDYICAKADKITTARYVRVYINGSTSNTGNHIYEIYVYGHKNTDNGTSLTDTHSLVEGYYTNEYFETKADKNAEGTITRYVSNKVLDTKVQTKYYENTKKLCIKICFICSFFKS